MAQLSWPVFILFRSYFRKTIFPDYIELTCPGLCGALFQINDCMSELTSPDLCGALFKKNIDLMIKVSSPDLVFVELCFKINNCMCELTSPGLCGALLKKLYFL